ncbi:nucleotide exchange factor GrpE [Patescibacteria group bacterium]|jgi:molecular chaperone GrpE|nr:nucleotide exchange factor GrpE [Patescibacteria group bacterium]
MNEEVSHPREGGDPESCAKCEEYLAGWKRAQADYQNLKKESEREKAEFAKYANERLLSDLLPALDQFGLALRFIPDTATLPEEEKKKWNNWLTGIKAVATLWEQAAKSAGLERISTEGAFDPTKHEAVGEEEGEESGTIIRTMQDGWMLNGKVLRPSKVIISK